MTKTAKQKFEDLLSGNRTYQLKDYDNYYTKSHGAFENLFTNKSFKYSNDLHRDDDLPAHVSYRNGKLFAQRWYKNGKQHRDGDLPAEIRYNLDTGKVSLEVYYKNGNQHRDGDLPAYSTFFDNGKPLLQIWYKNGLCHRDTDLPARIEYDADGVIKEKDYYKNDERHRDGDLPASYEYYGGDKLSLLFSVSYYKNGMEHRDNDKPAQIEYEYIGDAKSTRFITSQHYYIFGEHYKSIEVSNTKEYIQYKQFMKDAKSDDSMFLTNVNHTNKMISLQCKHKLKL